MTDWAAEAVTRGEVYVIWVFSFLMFWSIAHSIEDAIDRRRDVSTGLESILAQIRDRLPKEKPIGRCQECKLIALPDGHVKCMVCGRRER